MANPEVDSILEALGIMPADDGTVELFHATFETSAAAIQSSGAMVGTDGFFFCTSKSIVGRIVEGSDGALRVRVLVDDLVVHRDPDTIANVLSDAERQAEFLVLPDHGSEYRPAAVLGFERLDRDAFD